jgi:hypothetical protein
MKEPSLNLSLRKEKGKSWRRDFVTIGQMLKFAVAALFATRTHVITLNKEHFDEPFAKVANSGALVFDDHPVRNRSRAARHDLSINLDRAYATGPSWRQTLEVAKSRDVDAVIPGRLDDRLPLFREHLDAIDRDLDIALFHA